MKQKAARKCGDEHVLKGREPTQMGWYEFASALVSGLTVLDVGCGSGDGLRLLSGKAQKTLGIDLDERLKRADLEIDNKDISLIPDKSFDVVVSIDVIEHIEKDREFANHLVRVARQLIFISTPNYTVSRNVHPYHVREYSPYRFERMFSRYGSIRVFAGDWTGWTRREIRNKVLYYFLNGLYNVKLTRLIGKLLKRVLFMKLWPHQALIVKVRGNCEQT